MRLRLRGMTAGLAVGITVAVALASAAGAYLYSIHHFKTMLGTARQAALAQGHLIRVALEHQMMENDRTLIERMTRSFGQEAGIENVMILDREGRIRYTNAPPGTETDIGIESPTCQACHRLPPDERAESQVIETGQGMMLRTVIPLPNRIECHQCHDPEHRINGVLIVDRDAGEIRAMMNRDLRWMAAGTGGLAFLLVVALAAVMRFTVMRRLQLFETTARQIAGGDLEQRVPVKGSDTLAWLGHEFNIMADTMANLLKEVHEQREQLETVINGIEDGIVVLDVDRKVIAANDAFLRRRGESREAVLGSCCAADSADSCSAGDCPTQACLQLGRSQVRICEGRGPDGETIWEEVHASPIRRPSGSIVQIVEVWRDITKRRETEAHLAESHRLASLGLLASGFSHELNTPLATTLTCVESIQRILRKMSSSETAMGRIADSAETARDQLLRCRGITQHFLKLSRGQGQASHLVSLEPTIAAVTRLIEPTARSYSVSVRAHAVPEGLHVRANEAELQHVLLNLLLNAVQASERGAEVELAVRSGDPVRIRVTDNGPGIAPENRRRIFEPFFSGRRGGTGLGLYLSLDFVRNWGGEIRVESTPGHGATFEVVLPAEGGTR
jgi:PAS domain S-box-containing protein